MLVKFLSFIASVLSSSRYKAFLIPSIVLVLSLTSLTVVALVHENKSQRAASTTTQTSDPSEDDQVSPSQQIGSGNTPTPKNDDQPIAPPSSGANTDTGNSSSAPATAPAETVPTTEITLAVSNFSMTAGALSTFSMASLSDDSSAVWAITPETGEAGKVQPILLTEKSKDSAQNLNFRFRASPEATPGQYQFMLSAKDTARGISLIKPITVTITP